jgi:hypothetical protein
VPGPGGGGRGPQSDVLDAAAGEAQFRPYGSTRIASPQASYWKMSVSSRSGIGRDGCEANRGRLQRARKGAGKMAGQ